MEAVSEKGSNLIRNSVKGFEFIDAIKAEVKKAKSLYTFSWLSCADILAIVARDTTFIVSIYYYFIYDTNAVILFMQMQLNYT